MSWWHRASCPGGRLPSGPGASYCGPMSRKGSKGPSKGPTWSYLPKPLVEEGTEHIHIRVPHILLQFSVKHPEEPWELAKGSKAHDAAREGQGYGKPAVRQGQPAEQPEALASPPLVEHPAVRLQLRCLYEGLQGLTVELLVQQTLALQG